jgi:hypothetical protein
MQIDGNCGTPRMKMLVVSFFKYSALFSGGKPIRRCERKSRRNSKIARSAVCFVISQKSAEG